MDLQKLAGRAVRAHQSGDFREAEKLYRSFLAKQPDHPVVVHLLGALHQQTNRPAEAVALLKKAALLDPGNPDVHSNLAVSLLALRACEDAVTSAERAVRLGGGSEALYNLGTAQRDGGYPDKAEASFRAALDAGWTTKAAIALGALLLQQNALADGAEILSDALAKDPDSVAARDLRAFARRRLADWTDDSADAAKLVAACTDPKNPDAPSPLFVLATTDDPEAQLAAARKRVPKLPAANPPAIRPPKEKIGIAYLSPDFREHPVARLMHDVILAHDAAQFDVICASYGPDDGSALRHSLKTGTHWLDLETQSDAEAARALRDAGADIVVDLAGFTTHARPGLLAARPAPVQMNYLGYPGASGAPWIDYTIADPFLVPDLSSKGFSEKIIRLPGCFQANSARREPTDPALAKAKAGLPSGFVFCNHSNLYKTSPQQFALWMDILRDTPDSVLWLTADNDIAVKHLRAEAARRGVDPLRIVTRPVSNWDDYTDALPAADLFLDTFPFNAGTIASDVLWAGVPVVTLCGRSFASRMAGSLLSALGLEDLIADSEDDYVRIATALARDTGQLAAAKARLAQARSGRDVFRPDAMARKLESAYRHALSQSRKGAQPRSFDVPPV